MTQMDGIGVILVRPDKYASIATFVSQLLSGNNANRGGYVDPKTSPTTIFYFFMEFKERLKSLKNSFTRTVNPNGGVIAISLKQYDRLLTLNKGFVGSYNAETYPEYFEQGLEYAAINWAKDYTNKWSYLIRMDSNGIYVGTKIYSVKQSGYIYFQGLIEGYNITEDAQNNLTINQFQMSWGE